MSRKQIRRLGSFEATDPKGKRYAVVVSQEFIEAASQGSSEWIPGFKSLRTDDGTHVNVRDGKLFMLGFDGEVQLEPADPAEWRRFA